MRQVGCIQTNPSNPALIAALDEGITPETLADYARAAIEAGKQKPFGYAITAARSDRAQGVPPPGANNHANHSSPGRKLSVVEQVERNIADRKQREATAIDGESKRVGN